MEYVYIGILVLMNLILMYELYKTQTRVLAVEAWITKFVTEVNENLKKHNKIS